MMSTANQSQRQMIPQDEPIPLADLMESDSTLEPDYEVVEPPKSKRKRKPKPQPSLQIPYSVVIAIACLLLGFVAASAIAFVPTMRTAESSQPFEQSAPVDFNPAIVDPALRLDHWMMLHQAIGQIQANSFVRVLSQDDSPEFFNVVDLEGHLAIVRGIDLVEATDAPAADVYPPLGPYSEALGKNQKLLVTTEWNGDMPPGTLVYAMGWRAEDGTWIYEVSPDRVKIYYLPFIHLAWASGASIPTT
jgi:hypothetical protein